MVVSFFKKIGVMLSLNDPKWGGGRGNDKDGNKSGKPGDGPPDLDQLWQDFTQRLNKLVNGGGANGGPGKENNGGFSPESAGARIGAGMIFLILVFVWMISGFFVVQEGQTGVVMTFGKHSHDTPSGFNWRWPYPIQSHEIVNISQVRTVEVGYQSNVKNKLPKEALMLTDDENIIDIQFAVQYKLKSAGDWIFNNRDQENTVKQVAETAVREVVGRSKMDFVLYEGREKVAFDVGQLMQQILDRYKSGVQVTNVTMQGVQPPEQVQAAFDDAVKAGQDRERQKNEGQAYANDVIPKARGAAARLQEESQAYQARVVANAEGDASRFRQVLVEYQKAPAVTRDRLYLDTMQQIFAKTTKVMVDTKTGNNMIYLPLDKLIAQTLNQETAGQKTAAPVAATDAATGQQISPVGQESQLSRDSHSRDREGR